MKLFREEIKKATHTHTYTDATKETVPSSLTSQRRPAAGGLIGVCALYVCVCVRAAGISRVAAPVSAG